MSLISFHLDKTLEMRHVSDVMSLIALRNNVSKENQRNTSDVDKVKVVCNQGGRK